MISNVKRKRTILFFHLFPLEDSGSGLLTQNIAQRLAEKGHDIHIISLQTEGAPPSQPHNLVTSHQCSLSAFSTKEYPLFTNSRSSSLRFYDLTSKQINQYIEQWTIFFKKTIKKIKPDLIHVNHIWIGSYIASQFSTIPYIIMSHGTDLMGIKQDSRFIDLCRRGIKQTKKIIAISQFVKDEICNLFGEMTNIDILPNCYNEDIFHKFNICKKQFQNIPLANMKVIAFAGKLTPFKGVDDLLYAASLYEKKQQNIMTIIAGDGHLDKDLKSLSKKLDLKNCYFLGHQEQPVIAQLFNIADIAVFPSIQEPFGIVAIEALACGTPVIATSNGGFDDYIIFPYGTLVKSHAPNELSEAIIHCLSSKTKENVTCKCSHYAQQNFSSHSYANAIEDIYQQTMSHAEIKETVKK